MKESTIKALLQLFALIANVSDGKISSKAESIVLDSLKRAVSAEKLHEYVKLFNKYLEGTQKVSLTDKSDVANLKKKSMQSVKALVICEKNNQILEQHEKVRIISRLLEFTNEDGLISPKEEEFLIAVKDSFHISDEEYSDIYQMVLNPWIRGIRKEMLILIDRNEIDQVNGIKHLHWKGLNGQIIVLYIESCNIFMFKYLGSDNLLRSSVKVHPNIVEFLDPRSFIKGPHISTIYFSTLTARFFQDEVKINLEYTIRNVEFKFRNSENGVQQFSFQAHAGELVGVMGGSGVGKSTLLNVMNGSLLPQKGNIYINGYDLHQNSESLEGIIGYVPQDDLLMDDLTVFQNLYFNAKLCFSSYSEIGLLRVIIRLLKDLDLYEIRYLKVGNPLEKFISGGQRKRLNIGLELLREPLVLFVDEPTSGLSSMDAEMVMLLLRRQAIKGKLVIGNIHQPSSDIYKLFSKVMVMDKGGFIVYQGDPLNALVYFKTVNELVDADVTQCPTCGNVNPEQVLEIVETKYVNKYGRLTDIRRFSPKIWYDKYRHNIESKISAKPSRLELPEINFKIPSLWEQFKIFVLRDVMSKLENKQYLLITFLEAPILALIIGYFTKYFAGTVDDPGKYIFYGNDNMVSYIFMSVIVSLFLGMTLSAEEIIKDGRILKRESFLHLSRFSYINSKVFIVLIISAIQMATFVLIGNFMIEIKGMTFQYWLILFSTAAVANMIGLIVSASLKSVATIYIVIPLILVPQILFSGTVVPFDKLRSLKKHSRFVPVTGDLMTSRWAFEAIAVNQFKRNRFEKHFFDADMRMSRNLYKSSFLIPRVVGYLDESLRSLESGKDSIKVESRLNIVKNVLTELQEETGSQSGLVRYLTPFLFNETIYGRVRSFIDSIKLISQNNYDLASREKDEIYFALEKQLGGKDALLSLQDNYVNRSITDLVLNRNQLKKIIEYDGHLIQRMDPVFEVPHSKFGRAHMYAPVKLLGNFNIDTYWFNLLVLWFTIAISYLILYYDLLKKMMTQLESALIRYRDKKRLRIQFSRK
jgi:ABC-type multidrug transport system ATPase subunit